MIEGWELKPLKDVCIVQRGSSPRPIKSFITDDEDGVNWIKIGDTKNVEKYIYKTREKITKEGAKKSRFVDVGDFILSNSMSFGRPYIMKTQGYIHDGWFVFRLPENIDAEFFWYLLVSPNVKEQFQGLASGAIVKNISGDLVKKTMLPIPPLKEQKQIVTTLDKAFKQIDQAKANLEKNLNSAKELFQSKLNEVFSQRGEGWEEKTLGDVCNKNKNIKWSDNEDKEFQYIDLSSVSRETLKIKETTLINSETAPSRAKKIVNKSDIIFATTRPTLKRVTIIPHTLDNQICSTGFVVLKSKKDLIVSEIIYYFLQTTIFMNRMEELQRGASYPAVSDKDVNQTIINFPISIQEQNKIVDELDKFSELSNNLQTHYQQKLNNLEELKKSILQKAFKGELV